MPINSRDKGKRGERMLAKFLTQEGFPATRGQQFSGGQDSPDIKCPSLAHFHWEAKWCKNACLKDWMAQAEGDAGGKPWVIAWKRNHGPWMAIVKLETLLDLMREGNNSDDIHTKDWSGGRVMS